MWDANWNIENRRCGEDETAAGKHCAPSLPARREKPSGQSGEIKKEEWDK